MTALLRDVQEESETPLVFTRPSSHELARLPPRDSREARMLIAAFATYDIVVRYHALERARALPFPDAAVPVMRMVQTKCAPQRMTNILALKPRTIRFMHVTYGAQFLLLTRRARHVCFDGDERTPQRRTMATREKRTPKRFAFRHTSRHIRDRKTNITDGLRPVFLGGTRTSCLGRYEPFFCNKTQTAVDTGCWRAATATSSADPTCGTG